MINRRSVPALHRACLHQRYQPEIKNPDENFRAGLLKTDMTGGSRGTESTSDGGRHSRAFAFRLEQYILTLTVATPG